MFYNNLIHLKQWKKLTINLVWRIITNYFWYCWNKSVVNDLYPILKRQGSVLVPIRYTIHCYNSYNIWNVHQHILWWHNAYSNRWATPRQGKSDNIPLIRVKLGKWTSKSSSRSRNLLMLLICCLPRKQPFHSSQWKSNIKNGVNKIS